MIPLCFGIGSADGDPLVYIEQGDSYMSGPTGGAPALAVAEKLLEATISDDPGDIAEVYAEHVVIEMPFAVKGIVPSRIETGREELRSRFRAGRAVRHYNRLENVTVHETADPQVAIVEYELHGEMIADGQPFATQMLMVITVRDGAIVHSRDYTDPVAGARMLGITAKLVESLLSQD